MQKRAKIGGEIGANGEWYDGGKFIATTERPKGNVSCSAKAQQYQYEPRKWSVPPTQDARPILMIVGRHAAPIWEGRTYTKITLYAPYLESQGTDEAFGHKVQDLVDAWNRGERWFCPAQPSSGGINHE